MRTVAKDDEEGCFSRSRCYYLCTKQECECWVECSSNWGTNWGHINLIITKMKMKNIFAQLSFVFTIQGLLTLNFSLCIHIGIVSCRKKSKVMLRSINIASCCWMYTRKKGGKREKKFESSWKWENIYSEITLTFGLFRECVGWSEWKQHP